MKKTTYFVVLALSGALALGACKSGGEKVFQAETSESSSQGSSVIEPSNGAFAITDGYDWEQVMEDVEEVLNKDDYPMGEYLDYYVNEDEKTIGLIWPLNDAADIDVAFEYMAAYIKAFNDSAYTQNFSLVLSDETSYGSLWNEYNLYIEAFRVSDIVDIQNNLISQTIPAGSPIIIEEYVHQGEGAELEIPLDELMKESESGSESSN